MVAACKDMREAIRRRTLLFAVAVAAAVLPPPSPVLGEVVSDGCTRHCGNISIPFPFGVEPGCYIESGFNLTCDRSHRPPKLFLGDGTVPVLEISVPNTTVRINGTFAYFPGNDPDENLVELGTKPITAHTWSGALVEGGPYTLALGRNKLLVVGCDVQVLLEGEPNQALSTCASLCIWNSSWWYTGPSECFGVGCCQANIMTERSSYVFKTVEINGAKGPNSPALAWIVESESTYLETLTNVREEIPDLPAVLDWRIKHTTCHGNASSAACCSGHSFCKNSIGTDKHGHLCRCDPGYQGNPYVAGGCIDINECKSPETYPCYGVCKNTEGGYQCQCPPGFRGNASLPNGCQDINECANPILHSCYGECKNVPGTFFCTCKEGTNGNPFDKVGCRRSLPVLQIGLGASGVTACLLMLALGGPVIIRRIKLQRLKAKFFKQNKGLLLQQLISRNANISERMIITLRELEKATNNFDRKLVVGGGGHGIVFKGNLELHVVAIKRSKILVQREIDEFINEVVVLSQVNHRNVVKLLGCCLETEVPLLVYEFISNGTLCSHLHIEGPISLSWNDRMRIALEVSRALSYLHSSASMPIFHRDIKSSNILLDDSFTAKVADFGASRYVPIDHTGVTTAVQGTIGYLDPMYYTTGRLTNKSDVYSFGVVLVELLTRKKPFAYQSEDGGGLITHFMKLLNKGKLIDIIDPQVMEEQDGSVEEVAIIAAMCTKLKGEDRPTMREVEMRLENILVKKLQVPCHTTPWRDDDMQIVSHDFSVIHVAEETSRQYTMEEEILLSARYPR